MESVSEGKWKILTSLTVFRSTFSENLFSHVMYEPNSFKIISEYI